MHTAWWNQATGWNGWAPLQPPRSFAQGTTIAAVGRKPDQLDVFATSNDNRIYTAWWGPANGWGGWADVQAGRSIR